MSVQARLCWCLSLGPLPFSLALCPASAGLPHKSHADLHPAVISISHSGVHMLLWPQFWDLHHRAPTPKKSLTSHCRVQSLPLYLARRKGIAMGKEADGKHCPCLARRLVQFSTIGLWLIGGVVPCFADLSHLPHLIYKSFS